MLALHFRKTATRDHYFTKTDDGTHQYSANVEHFYFSELYSLEKGCVMRLLER